jgi:hypothetical protein
VAGRRGGSPGAGVGGGQQADVDRGGQVLGVVMAARPPIRQHEVVLSGWPAPLRLGVGAVLDAD